MVTLSEKIERGYLFYQNLETQNPLQSEVPGPAIWAARNAPFRPEMEKQIRALATLEFNADIFEVELTRRSHLQIK